MGRLSNLEHLILNDNSLERQLPLELADLSSLKTLGVKGNSVCAPHETRFQAWLSRLEYHDATTCATVLLFRPRLLSAAASGAALSLTYSKPLDESSRPAPGDFTVNVNGSPRAVAAVAISGPVVSLTLSEPVSRGDAVTTSYAPGANPIRDKPGGEEEGSVAQSDAEGHLNREVANHTLPGLSIVGGRAAEDSGAVGFTVRLAPASEQVVTVAWATSDGTATAGADYVRSGGTLRFRPGRTFVRVSVALVADALQEGDETFVVTLTGPGNAAVSTARATGTILGDESGAPAQEPLSLEVDADGGVEPPAGAELDRSEMDTLAGTGESGYGGDGGPASDARFSQLRGVALDGAGNVYVADTFNHRIRRIDAVTGVVETLAGTGQAGSDGDGGPAAQAQLNLPTGLAVDSAGNVYVTDTLNHRIRRIDAATGVIRTLAGTGEVGSGGDGGPASEAQLSAPWGVAVDSAGDVYVADTLNHRIRRIDAATGVIETLAGTGEAGSGGDGGPASAAQLQAPWGVAVDGAGNVYVADTLNRRIRRIDAATGLIETLAGGSGSGAGGESGAVSGGELAKSSGAGPGEAGYLGAFGAVSQRIRRVDRPAGRTAVLGAAGGSGDGGPASEARFSHPSGVAVDGAGNVYVTDSGSHRVRRIDAATGLIETLAGAGVPGGGGDGGPASLAQLDEPLGVAVGAAGKAYVADSLNHRVRVIEEGPSTRWISLPLGTSDAAVSLRVSGDGALRWSDGTPVLEGARFTAANGNEYAISKGADEAVVAVYVPPTQRVGLAAGASVVLARDEDGTWRLGPEEVGSGYRHVADGREYLLELADGQWRRALYTLRTVAGSDDVVDGVPASAARLFSPCGVAIDALGNAYIGDGGNRRIRKVDALTGQITTHAGTGNWEWSEDGGLATETAIRACNVVVDGGNNVYATDRFRIRRIGPDGAITTHAGTAEPGDSGDGGPAVEARLGSIAGMAVDSLGNMYVADTGNHRVRRIDVAGTITTYAGTGEPGDSGDGGPAAEARLSSPYGVAADTAGNVYVADTGNHRVRRIDAAGTITTYAGTGEPGDCVDGGPAAEARLSSPYGVAADTAGNVYVADTGNHRVRRIDATGTITTYAGTGEPGDSGDGGPAAEARLSSPFQVAADTVGDVYVVDRTSHRVRRIDTAGVIAAYAGTGQPFDAGDGGPAAGGRFDLVQGVAVDALGNVYVADRGAHRVRRIDAAGTITTLAGTGQRGYAGDGGTAAEAELAFPAGVAVDPAGYVYVADTGNHAVRAINPDGTIATVAGTGRAGRESLPGGIVPEAGTRDLQLSSPQGIAVDAAGQVYVSDTFNKRIVRVFSGGPPNVAVGNAPAGELQQSPWPYVLAVLKDGSIVVSAGSRLIGSMTGAMRLYSHLEGGLLLDNEARVTGLAVDESLEEPSLYVADSSRIRRIAGGSVTTVAESRAAGGFSGDGGAGVGAGLSVGGIALDGSGNIWFTDTASRRVRVLEPVSSDIE